VTCTITVENLDPDHGVANLRVANTVPFPGSTACTSNADCSGGRVCTKLSHCATVISGCATSLAPNDTTPGSGTDFTSCTFQEVATIAGCASGTTKSLIDMIETSGMDA